jgi:hypothetical protein
MAVAAKAEEEDGHECSEWSVVTAVRFIAQSRKCRPSPLPALAAAGLGSVRRSVEHLADLASTIGAVTHI